MCAMVDHRPRSSRSPVGHHALGPEALGQGALHQADRRVAGQVGHHRVLRPARRGIGRPGGGERGAHLGRRVTAAGDHLRGGRGGPP